MADTWRQNAIVEAIQIITDRRIAQAGYDKTIKGIINNVLDSAAGKYEIKYQDSLFEAYATSSDLNYQIGQMVSILIPGNDWSRVKTILGGISNQTLIQNEIPVASNQYNQIGMSATTVNNVIGLSSYKPDGDSIILALNGYSTDSSYLSISSDAYDYIKKGDSLAFRMIVRTSLAPSQVGGDYGVIFRLVFKDGNGQQTIRNYIVSNKHVIGQPYALQAYTPVEVLYTDVDTQNFIRIDSIQAFCEGFPEDEQKEDKDIFISGITVNGADALNEEALTGYSMHILDSYGTVLTESKKQILLTAQLKSKGKIVTQNVVYYWGIEDGTIFKGSDKYCGWLGDGWRCLNTYDSNLRSYISFETPDFYFTTYQPQFDEYDGIRNKALARSKKNNIICVAVLQGNSFSGQIQIENQTLAEVKIVSSELTETGINKTIYYLDNGHPDLTCYVDDSEETNGYTYKWSIFPKTGKGNLVNTINQGDDDYEFWKNTWKKQQEKLNKVAENQQNNYKLNTQSYIEAENNIKRVQTQPYVYKNIYYNFPIKEISGSMKISCTVYQGETYIGTGSITLQNRRQLEGMYSLNIENGTQVFQYDGKGNSPASKQLQKPLQILPLRFTLVDNHGKQITHQQIRQNGWIKWIIPSTQTMLSKVDKMDYPNGATDISVIRADLPLAADYWQVYENLDSFQFAIDDRYDSKKNINYIWLNVKYKDMILDAYTDFSFPKDGDPGTNGTDLVAKITPSLSSDRLYISNKNTSLLFNDQGAKVQNLKFQLYNNSNKLDNILANNWTVPPKTKNGDKEDIRTGRKSYLSVSPVSGQTTTVTFSSGTDQKFDDIKTDEPVNIIRAQYGTGNDSGDLRYYAQIPICTNYIKNGDYRIKVKPKTGFSYVVYNSDGTSPDYDNTMPFEIIVEKLVGQYYMTEQETYTYTFDTIGNLKNGTQNENKYTVQPKDSYNGYDLSSAVICQIKHGSTEIGFIHIPVYMIINRYNNRALNSWDGNSVQIDANGHGQILTPQIAAGAKDTDNAFTGMLMGQIALNTPDPNIGNDKDIGLMGYDSGVRTIFLDANTGKAEFGKNDQGKIIIDPDTKINGQAAALLYSNTYPLDYFLQHPNVQEVGQYYKTDRDAKGLLIDLSTPQIGFGNGNFTVNSEGHLIARGGGKIAGWTLADTKLHKDNKVGMASSNETVPTDHAELKNGNSDTVAFWAGGTLNTSGANNGKLKSANFYATHGGYLFAKLGQIAGWDFDSKSLAKNKVGMNSDPNNSSYSVSGHNSKAFFANGNNFYVTHDGYLRSTYGQIANWNISTNMLTDGNIGMGQYNFNNTNPFGVPINARIWGGSTSGGINFKLNQTTFNPPGLNFAVSTQGYLYSKQGKIGGWNIEKDKLWAINKVDNNDGIRIKAEGSLDGKNWKITKNGNAYFQNIWGNIQAVKADGNPETTNIYYLTGGGFTASSGGGYDSGNGIGYRLGSNGTMFVGGSGGSMDFNGSKLTVNGRIEAYEGYIGKNRAWTIGDDGISNPSGSYLYPNRLSINDNGEIMTMVGGSIKSSWVTATKFFKNGDYSGTSGVLTFSDHGEIEIRGGIVVRVKPGEGATWP